MIINTGITIYHREHGQGDQLDVWTRVYLPEAWWFESQKSSVTNDGLQVADVTTIRIPDTSATVKKDDYIVKGNCDAAMGTVKDLGGFQKVRVTASNYNMFGGNPHIRVVGV